MWQPLMWPTEYTAAKIANAKQNEIVESSALPNGFLPVNNRVSGTEPAPMKTRIAVPIASAVNFWGSVGDDIARDLLVGSELLSDWVLRPPSRASLAAQLAPRR